MPLENQTVRDGDAGFIGFASRLNPVALPAGVLQLSENMRLDRGTAKTRRGVKRLADDILQSGFPLTVPFTLDPNLPVQLPFNLTLDPAGQVVRDSYDGGIFAGLAYRSPSADNGGECIVLAGTSEAYVYQDPYAAYLRDQAGNLVTDGLGNPIQSGNFPPSLAYPSGETISENDTVSMLQAFDRLYLLREAWTGEQGFEQKPVTANISVVGTTATVTSPLHGYLSGYRVRISGSDVAAFDGAEYDIVTSSTNTFTITVPTGTASDTSITGRTVRRTKAPLYWNGEASAFVKAPAGIPTGLNASYRSMRSVGFGAYIQNRMWIPDGRDTVAVSDYLDANVYDPFFQSFRANQGSNDYIVAIHPWRESEVLIFMRHSIWLATIGQVPSTDGSAFAIDTPISQLTLLTQEVGCVARRTIQTAGNFVYFLADNGVHRLDTALDLKLQGNTLPLSDPIADQLANINYELAEHAVGLYFDNRYYLSVPIDGALGAGQTAQGNNTLLIYSALNQQWETKDIYGSPLDDLIVSAYEARRRIHAVSRSGKLFLLEEQEAGDDPSSGTVGAGFEAPVQGKIRTRRYGFDSMHTKRFVRSLADVVLPDTAAISVKAYMVNPDSEITLVPGQTNTSGLAEDYTLKQPIRQKAHYAELEFLTTANRPEIRNVSIEATVEGLPQTQTRNAA
jgi:hypothetical protein